MKRKLFVSIGAVAILALTLYVVDFVVLRIKVARGDGYDLVQVHVVYQIPQKGNKAEYVPGDPQTESCARFFRISAKLRAGTSGDTHSSKLTIEQT